MKFECIGRSEWLVDPGDLAERLGMTLLQLEAEQALGLVRVWIEDYCEGDAGLSRITVQSRHHSWQGIFDQTGALLSHH